MQLPAAHPPARAPTTIGGQRAVFRNEGLPLSTRMKAAIEAAPYCHPKLAVAITVDSNDFAARLERAIE